MARCVNFYELSGPLEAKLMGTCLITYERIVDNWALVNKSARFTREEKAQLKDALCRRGYAVPCLYSVEIQIRNSNKSIRADALTLHEVFCCIDCIRRRDIERVKLRLYHT